ncbi:MAG: TIGR01906 family membrane protein [Clostridiales bacterium]|jgi:integral membrane protein (TIGR01906 family)|nr:TIGR01906 family membrane protein [Clostridiales bacterium]
MLKALYFVNSCAIVLILLSVSVFLPTFNRGFYAAEFDKLGISEKIGVSEADLAKVADTLINYMRVKTSSLDVTVSVNGNERPFFNEREIYHMQDVQALFAGGFLLRNISFAFFFAVLILAAVKKDFYAFMRCTFFSVLILLASSVLLTAVISLNFDAAFTKFHEIFFNNDLWILNPATDLLINIVPLNFFMDLSRLIAAIFIGFIAVLLTALWITGRKLKKV